MDKAEIYEKATEILKTWSKEDLIGDILELTTLEGLEDFIIQNEERFCKTKKDFA